jgi:regulator of replication initiation timing
MLAIRVCSPRNLALGHPMRQRPGVSTSAEERVEELERENAALRLELEKLRRGVGGVEARVSRAG